MDQPAREERYRGKPLLILLENYALALIGAMPGDHEAQVAAKVCELLGGEPSDWKSTVRQAAGLPEDFDARIALARQSQQPGVSPRDFVIAISDANFVDLVDPA